MPESTKTDETAAVEPENKEVVEEAKAALAKPSGDEETNNNSEETGTKVAEDGTTEDKAPETEQGSEKASEETEQEPEKESIEKPESNGTVTDLHRRIIEQVEVSLFYETGLPVSDAVCTLVASCRPLSLFSPVKDIGYKPMPS